jgi:hypothetical protein
MESAPRQEQTIRSHTGGGIQSEPPFGQEINVIYQKRSWRARQPFVSFRLVPPIPSTRVLTAHDG